MYHILYIVSNDIYCVYIYRHENIMIYIYIGENVYMIYACHVHIVYCHAEKPANKLGIEYP